METFGRYQLLRPLATGGMGQIYLARQQGPVGFEKLLAVKRILPHLAKEKEFIEMFFDEARIAAALNHPNIAQIYELGDVNGDYFIAMEYVHGESVRGVENRAGAALKGGIPLGLKCRIIADAAAGLDFAHRARSSAGRPLGLIHRDVSPQNILVGFNGGVKLIDFGVAKAAGRISTTLTGSLKGKYAYMSPEHARGEELDARSDIFCLGIILHELLTGQRLFRKESEPATLKAVAQAKVPAPSSLAKGVPRAVDAIVLKALARKRDERYQDAGQLQLALEDVLMDLKLPATGAHLATFMRDLYADVLRQEAAENSVAAPIREEPAQQKTPSSNSSKKRLSFDEIADQRTRVAAANAAANAGATKAPTQSSSLPPPQAPERASPLVLDIGELDARLAAIKPTDRTSGVFFRAVLDAVSRYAGPIAVPVVRAAAEEIEYQAMFTYPTSGFFHLLWKAGEVIAPMCERPDQALVELGRACFDGLLESIAGRTLSSQARPVEPAWMLTACVGSLQALIQPGERRIEVLGPKAAAYHGARELLPGEFLRGLFGRCFERLAEATHPLIQVEPGTGEALRLLRLRIQW